jgi:hypothetical protein
LIHPDIHKKQADIGVALKQRQSVVPVVGVEHCQAEFDEHVDSGRRGTWDCPPQPAQVPSRSLTPAPQEHSGLAAPGCLNRGSPPRTGTMEGCRLPNPQQTRLTPAAVPFAVSTVAVAMSACLPRRRSPAGRTGSRGAKLAAGAWPKYPTRAIFAATPSTVATASMNDVAARALPRVSPGLSHARSCPHIAERMRPAYPCGFETLRTSV